MVMFEFVCESSGYVIIEVKILFHYTGGRVDWFWDGKGHRSFDSTEIQMDK